MPQAPEYLREEFDDDQAAWKVLNEHYREAKGGLIVPRVAGYKATEQENRALDYLWLEWDYGFEGTL